jgi:ankyrin repeat protein
MARRNFMVGWMMHWSQFLGLTPRLKGSSVRRKVEAGDIAAMQSMLEHPDFDPNQKDPVTKKSLLALACKKGDEAMVALLLSDPRTEVNDGSFRQPCVDGKEKIVSLFLRSDRLRVNEKRKNQSQTREPLKETTPFFDACMAGRMLVIKQLLLDPRVDTNEPNGHEWTPLFMACYQGKIEVVKVLLQDSRTDIHRAGKNPLRLGELNAKKITPLEIAQKLGLTEIVELLEKASEPKTKKKISEELLVNAAEGKLSEVKSAVNAMKKKFRKKS